MSTGAARLNLQRRANHFRAVVHDMQAHARTVSDIFWQAHTIVRDAERHALAVRAQFDQYVLAVPVLDGVVHGFLRDAIEVSSHGDVMDVHGPVALKSTADVKEFLHLTRPPF